MKHIIQSIITGVISFVLLSMNSCKSASEDLIPIGYQSITAESNLMVMSAMDIMMKTIVVPEKQDSINYNGMNKASIPKSTTKNVTPVIVDLELVEPSVDVNISSIKTYGDMYALKTAYDVDFYVMENEPIGLQAVIEVSEEQTLAALQPLIDKSKKYLYRKGFTEAEIIEMLTEYNASPAALIPLVLVLCEDDANYEAQELITNLSGVTRSSSYIQKSFGCVASALGADVIAMLITEAPNLDVHQWTKAAIKLLFKKIAPRVIGVVGAAIACIEYFDCMNH